MAPEMHIAGNGIGIFEEWLKEQKAEKIGSFDYKKGLLRGRVEGQVHNYLINGEPVIIQERTLRGFHGNWRSFLTLYVSNTQYEQLKTDGTLDKFRQNS